VLLYDGLVFQEAEAARVRAAEPVSAAEQAMDADLSALPDDSTLRTGQESPGQVVFSHASHGEAPCATCHVSGRFSILKAVAPRPTMGEAAHGVDRCGLCHDGRKAFAIEDCESCHAPR
jgi:c(7)-type cytochrome triheme protein